MWGGENLGILRDMMAHFYTCFLTILFLAFTGAATAEKDAWAQPIVASLRNKPSLAHGEVAICMMFQNEGPFLAEWLAYHQLIGVKHFYLYNNGSTDNFRKILKPYIKQGTVELFHLPQATDSVLEHNILQKRAYTHALDLAKPRHRWLAIIDSDEYICMTRSDNLPEFLREYLYAPGLVVNWVMFGSSGVQELGANQLQIKHFIYRAPDACAAHALVKSIVQVRKTEAVDIHLACYKGGEQPVYADHTRYDQANLPAVPPIEKIRLNHYWWRSENYFHRVKWPRYMVWNSALDPNGIEGLRALYNSKKDLSMQRFIPRLKKLLKQTSKK